MIGDRCAPSSAAARKRVSVQRASVHHIDLLVLALLLVLLGVGNAGFPGSRGGRQESCLWLQLVAEQDCAAGCTREASMAAGHIRARI